MLNQRVRDRSFSLAVFFGVVCCAIFGSAGSARAQSPPPWQPRFVDSWEGIHAFQVFDYAFTPDAVTAAAPGIDFYWGSTHVDAARAGNESAVISKYIPFRRDPDATHTLAWWRAFHPDWVVYKCDRVTPAYEFGRPNMPLDISNPAVVQWQIDNFAVPASAAGYDALAADNLVFSSGTGGCGVWSNGVWVQRYNGTSFDYTFIGDVIRWTATMQKALHALPTPMALVTNVELNATDYVFPLAIGNLDGIIDEGGFTGYGAGFLTGAEWLRKVDTIKRVQALGKAYYIINQVPATTSPNLQWVMASYLMAKDHSAGIWIARSAGYGSDQWQPDYDAAIGHPCGDMYLSHGVYVRDYSGGVSLVNASASTTSTFTLATDAAYSDLSGLAVGPTMDLGPHSGVVLLADADRCP